MTKIVVTTLDGIERTIKGEAGVSAMEVMRNHGVDDLSALCGGCCSCATCHVYVLSPYFDYLPAATDVEESLLSGSIHRRQNSRLSCQIMLDERLDGLRIAIAPED